MSICHLRVLVGRRGALHEGVLTHPSDSANRDTLATAVAKGEELRHFDTEQAFLEASVNEEIYIKLPEENHKFLRTVGLLNKIHGLVQAERCWFNKFRYDRTAIGFKQPEVDPCMFHKFDDGQVEKVVVVLMRPTPEGRP